MMLPIYLVVGVINIFASLNDYNIPNTPEFKDLRVRRSAGEIAPYGINNKVQDGKVELKDILNGNYFRERSKRSYQVYPQNNANQGYWNNYAGSYQGYYNNSVYNTSGSNGYDAASRAYYKGYANTYSPYKPLSPYGYPSTASSGYNAPGYNGPPTPGYSTPAPGYFASTTPGYVKSTTPYIVQGCIICNIGCPQFMKRMGIFCVDEDDDEE